MRVIALVAVLALPLAGCATSLTSLSLPSGKTVPEWAMNAQAEADDATPAKPQRRVARRNAAPRVAAAPDVQPDTTPTNSAPAGMLPQSREYREREEAIEQRLRKQMNICGAC